MRKVIILGVFCASLGLVWAGTTAGKHKSKKPVTTQQAATTIKFEDVSHNFGNVIEGEIARYDFKFTNTGTEPLVLTNVQASCGCTTPKWPRDPIAAGASAVITAEYNSNGRPGSFTKNIFVKSNGGDVTLTISGMVIKEPEKPKSPIIIKG
jgi:hypothetical protein